MDVGFVVLSRGEGCRIEGVGVGPDGFVSGAVGVVVVEDHVAGAVRVEIGGAVHENGRDDIAADIGDGTGDRINGIHQAGHGGSAVFGHAGDSLRQGDVEGKCPVLEVACAISIGVRVCDIALATVEAGAVDGGLTRSEDVVAGVGDGGRVMASAETCARQFTSASPF